MFSKRSVKNVALINSMIAKDQKIVKHFIAGRMSPRFAVLGSNRVKKSNQGSNLSVTVCSVTSFGEFPTVAVDLPHVLQTLWAKQNTSEGIHEMPQSRSTTFLRKRDDAPSYKYMFGPHRSPLLHQWNIIVKHV